MDDNEEVELPQESESIQESSNSKNNIVNKKIQERLSKSVKSNAVKKSLIKVLLPILIYIFIFLVILIIIIGIILFFITMPGMVIEQIKNLGKSVGNALKTWFGEDQTEQVEEVKFLETLDCLEQMNYDLKGYGFLTDYVGEDNDGVERNVDDGKIINAESQFISSYLVSDNYVYTIKNFNQRSTNPIAAIGRHLASLFTLGQANQYWTRGMIDIWIDNGIGKKGSYYDVYNLGSIDIDVENKELEIGRGWFNNSMKYNLDGWTGRYGMPVDFLISLHLATMMPDLAYDMASGFDTEIQLLLHPIGGGEEEDNTAIGYYRVGDNYVSYDDFEEYASSGFTGSLNSWRISKKEAKEIMDAFGIESPDTCLGTEGVGEDEIKDESKIVQLNYGITSTKRIGDSDYDDSQTGINNKQEVVDTYNGIINELKGYGLTDEEVEGAGLRSDISDFEEYRSMLETQEQDDSNTITPYEPSKALTTQITWQTDDEGYESYTAEIDLKYENYDEHLPAGGGFSVYNRAIMNYKITGIWTDERIEEFVEENNISVPEEARCSQADVEAACSACRAYIQRIYNCLRRVDVGNLDIYQPYISKVKNHWYRDVYFVSDPTNPTDPREFVDYDYDYESVMKERWTLYETYGSENPDREGEYKLYEINEDGSFTNRVFNGTAEEASSEGIKVAKKARMKQIVDMADDLNWQEVDGLLSAYKVDNVTQQDFQAVYPDITEDDPDYDILSNIYVCIRTTGNVTQVGEGQRTETNPKIKKLFLQNRYFKYDGSQERAEIITALRKNIAPDGYYGPVKGEDSNGATVDYTNQNITIDGNTYKVSDYSGEVSLNQDSLNAFSMLENEHTLDSDYIYRDFKELIVELGYFEKEELTDETPRLLQFLVPDAGSSGFPSRAIDKNEHEYGTMIHSKGDIEANKANTLKSIIADAIEAASDESNDDNTQIGDTVSGISEAGKRLDNVVGSIVSQDKTDSQFVYVGSSNSTNTSSSLLSLEEWWEETQKIFDIYKNEGWVYSDHGGGQSLGCNANHTFEEARERNHHDTDCSIGASWMLHKLGALQEPRTFTSHMADSGTLDTSGTFADCAQDLLDAGAEVIIPKSGTKFTSAANSGELEPGDILFYEGHVSIYCGDSYESGGVTFCWDTGSTSGIQNGGPRDTSYETRDIKLILRLPLGNSKATANSYEGYVGNEAVVSPVTGILLEYGTYDGVEKDSVTGETYRTNIDLKHGTGIFGQSNESTNQVSENESKIQVDKVGYAKILVLDKENYKKIEQKLLDKTRWSNSFLADTGKYRNIDDLSEEQVNDENNPWTDLDKTLYGYKEFAENYEEFGIAGNVIYVEGFSAELPDENFNPESDLDTSSPDGEDLGLSNFENVGLSSFSGGNISNEDDLLASLYQKDGEYKLASKKATEKLNAENIVKEEAVSSLYVDGLRVIKEGTVIGRTITDRELIVDYRNENYEDYRQSTNSDNSSDNGEEINTDKVIGNYIRIIMRDLDKTVVENVEDYMKLDNGEEESTGGGAQPYVVQDGDDILLANIMHLEGCTNGFEGMGYSPEDADSINMMTGYVLLNRAIVNFGGYGTTIKEQLLAPGQYSTSYASNNTEILCMDCYENAKLCLQYDCDYVKNPEGVEMTHDVLGQSGWDQCSNKTGTPGESCFWWVDDNFDGIPNEYTGGGHFDEFFCYNSQYAGM